MKKIVITGGRYGYISPSGVYDVKTAASAPFEVDDKEAARLVKLGVAKIHGEGGKCPENEGETPEAGSNSSDTKSADTGESGGNIDGIPEYDIKSSVNDLRTIAKKEGISFKVGMKKEEMIQTLDEYFGFSGDDDFKLPIEDPV